MFWIIKDNKVVSTSSEFIASSIWDTVKISDNFTVLNSKNIENHEPIKNDLQYFIDEVGAENKVIQETFNAEQEEIENNDEDIEVWEPSIKQPDLIPWEVVNERFNAYLDTFKEDNFDIVVTEESREEEYITQIENINNEFDNKISEYLSKYPKREQDTFAEKKREAEKVMDWEVSLYIESKAKAIGISAEQFAQIIIAKNEEWTVKYIELENEKDYKISKIKK